MRANDLYRKGIERAREMRRKQISSVPLGSTIQVKINNKIVPCKTTSHCNRDYIEASANGKKYLCEWSFGQWSANSTLRGK